MVCRTPDLRGADVMRNMSTLAVLHYGFIMDDVQSVLDMSTQLPVGYFLDIYPDPEFDGFVNGVKQMFQPRNDYLTINVRSCHYSADIKPNCVYTCLHCCRSVDMSYDDCLENKREDTPIRTVLCCVVYDSSAQ